MSASPPHPLLTGLGREVRSRRLSKGWTIRELAERSQLSARFVSDIEAGRGNVSVLKLARLAEVLGLAPHELLAAADQAREVIALLGLRGAGKSTLGPQLAQALGVEFHELDALVEEAAGLSLSEIFALHGESYYRELERQTLADFLSRHSTGVLATGGGIVTDPETYALLRRHCTLVWLKARPEDHWERVIQQGDRRPMADNPEAMEELRTLLAERSPLYSRADYTIDTAVHGIEGTVEQLRRQLG